MPISTQVYGVAHLIQVLTLRGVAQAVSLGLNVVGFGLYDTRGKRSVIDSAVITL